MVSTSVPSASLDSDNNTVGKAFMEMLTRHSANCALDLKTTELLNIAVLSVTKKLETLPSHVKLAKQKGASRDEIKSAVLLGISAVGVSITDAFNIALKSYDE